MKIIDISKLEYDNTFILNKSIDIYFRSDCLKNINSHIKFQLSRNNINVNIHILLILDSDQNITLFIDLISPREISHSKLCLFIKIYSLGKGVVTVNPNILVANQTSQISHSVSLGTIDENYTSYLFSKGLDLKNITKLILSEYNDL